MRRSSPSRGSIVTVLACLAAAASLGACASSDESGQSRGNGLSTGGATGAGGSTAQGGSTGAGLTGSGLTGSGGQTSTGGTPATGGTISTGGVAVSGGTTSTGGRSTGGASTQAGAPSTGGISTGGVPSDAGASSGGAAGGALPTGGRASSGGAGGAAGGASGSGGSSAGAPSMCPPATPLSGGKQYCSNQTGTITGGGYSYELWAEGSGSGCMTVHGKDATFSANWNGVEDLLARTGLTFDRTRKHAQIGDIWAEFAHTKTETDDGGLVYIGMYGWTVNPLKEYYILDDWGATKPAGFSSDGTPRTSVGTITVDGETYDVWKKLRENKPAITGPSETFEQYFSIRRTARQCGRISVSEHFEKWEELGLAFGNLTEVMLLLEAQDSSGTISFTTAKVGVD